MSVVAGLLLSQCDVVGYGIGVSFICFWFLSSQWTGGKKHPVWSMGDYALPHLADTGTLVRFPEVILAWLCCNWRCGAGMTILLLLC